MAEIFNLLNKTEKASLDEIISYISSNIEPVEPAKSTELKGFTFNNYGTVNIIINEFVDIDDYIETLKIKASEAAKKLDFDTASQYHAKIIELQSCPNF